MKSISTKELNKKAYEYILYCIDSYDKDISKLSDKEKLQELYSNFKAEKDWEIERIGEYQAFISWIQGLPTYFNIEFENYKILELAKKWGSIPQNATDKEEQKILNNYWNFIMVKTFQLFRKHKII